jgi:hypothetical protein
MGSENKADQAWDFWSNWFFDIPRFYRVAEVLKPVADPQNSLKTPKNPKPEA